MTECLSRKGRSAGQCPGTRGKVGTDQPIVSPAASGPKSFSPERRRLQHSSKTSA